MLALNPSDPRFLFAGTSGGGVFDIQLDPVKGLLIGDCSSDIAIRPIIDYNTYGNINKPRKADS